MNRLKQLNEISKARFNFRGLIEKNSNGEVKSTEETEGYRDPTQGGAWIPGTIVETIIEPAAIVPLNKDDLVFGEAGTYNNDDRKIYCYKRMKKGTVIEHTDSKGCTKTYTVLSDVNYSDFDTTEDGLFIYIIRRGDRD